ncbi:uncharacterized protein N7458_000506 [Penicillium daleae]|uniref:Uncharacterized protein n=1 Tax=Penicillium daleae TaxID=63821 RepID=A0AAD6CGY3_9EURO|nr:uncharacterized protein N7458_000506 [Penicillium daleae]KAJ5464820.1 hypothetical protein N7458_000506 [Penicillium daleae]
MQRGDRKLVTKLLDVYMAGRIPTMAHHSPKGISDAVAATYGISAVTAMLALSTLPQRCGWIAGNKA